METILASLLVSGVIILLGAALETWSAERKLRPRRDGPTPPVPDRWFSWLANFPVPDVLARRWCTPVMRIRLVQAGLPLDPQSYAGLHWGALWVGAAAGIGLDWLRHGDLLGQFLLLLSVGAGILAPDIWIRSRVERRQGSIDRALADVLDRLALGLEAGLGFEVALRRTAASFPGLLGDELRRSIRRLDLGHRRQDVLAGLASISPSQDLHAFVAAVAQADRLGTSMAKALRIQTGLLRGRRRRRAQEASRRLPILIVFPLVFFFLPALLIIYLAPPLLHLFLGR